MSPSKYSDYHRTETKKPYTIHPVWRGVGFAFIILIPIMAWATMDLFISEVINKGVMPVPTDLVAQPGQLLYRLIPDPMLYIKVLVFFVAAFFFYIIFLMIASIVTRIVMGNPAQRDPFYVPQMARRRKNIR